MRFVKGGCIDSSWVLIINPGSCSSTGSPPPTLANRLNRADAHTRQTLWAGYTTRYCCPICSCVHASGYQPNTRRGDTRGSSCFPPSFPPFFSALSWGGSLEASAMSTALPTDWLCYSKQKRMLNIRSVCAVTQGQTLWD